MVRAQGNSPGDIAQGHADQKRGDDAADGEARIPKIPPPFHRLFAPKLDGHRAENKRHQQQHEGQVESGKDGGIDFREGREESAAACDQPNLVPIPNGPDGIEEDPAFLVRLYEKMEGPHPQVEAVQDGVTGKKDSDQDEPKGLPIRYSCAVSLLHFHLEPMLDFIVEEINEKDEK